MRPSALDLDCYTPGRMEVVVGVALLDEEATYPGIPFDKVGVRGMQGWLFIFSFRWEAK